MADMDGIERNEPAFIARLAMGQDVRSSARKEGIPETTAYRMASDPQVVAEVETLRADLIERLAGRVGSLMLKSVDTLAHLQASAKTEAVRLKAAESLIRVGLKLREDLELEARIRKLEGSGDVHH